MIDKASEHEAVITKIKELDLEQMSPIEAWQTLHDLQQETLGES
jgi:hypothetical protein